MDFSAYPFAAGALASFLLGQVLVATRAHHGRFSMDAPGAAIHKFHLEPTPRIGGIGIYLALLALRSLMRDGSDGGIVDTVLVAGIPALLIGLLEDVTKRVSPRSRLAATGASGLLAAWMSGVSLGSLDVPGVDTLLKFGPISILFTAFAVAGVANAVNIIDGFNGLASGTVTIAATALALVAAHAGDAPLAAAASALAAVVAGFWLVNFPWGKLFLGDGGAYFAGFALAWMAVLLPIRNPGLSPWVSFLLCGYPVIEALYSIARRWRNRQSPACADRAHLHSLVATRVVQPRLGGLHPTLQNSAVSVLMWICAGFPALLGVILSGRTIWLVASAGGCVLLYHWLYRHVARA